MDVSLRILLLSLVVLILSVIFGWIGHHYFAKTEVLSMVTLKPGTYMRQLYMKVPFPISFKIYVFNITNPSEVLGGAKPIVEEIGPYVFEEWKEKILESEDHADDTMTFYTKDTYYFNQKKSGNLTGQEIISLPHPLILSMVLKTLKERPAMLSMLNKAINSIFNNPKSIFLSVPVNDLFFKGVLINCTVRDFAGKAVCEELRSQTKIIEIVSDNIFQFSLFGTRNGTASVKLKVHRGMKDYRNAGRVIEFDDQSELNIWGSRNCNQFNGTDGTIFPALLEEGQDIPVFVPFFCRSLTLKFVDKLHYGQIPVSKYAVDFGDMSTMQADKCYCPSPETCWKKGLLDLSKCSAPIVVSLPHFYNSDESYAQALEGLHPNKNEHEFFVYFEMTTGAALSVRNRAQFSLPLTPVNKVAVMKDLPHTLMPILWIDEGFDLNSTYTKSIKLLFYSLTVMESARWAMIVISAAGVAFGIFSHFSKKVEPNDTTLTVREGSSSHYAQTVSKASRTIYVMSGHEFNKYN